MQNFIRTSSMIAILLMVVNLSYANNYPLTEEQKLLLLAGIKEDVENSEAFRSTLDVFQIAIIHSKYADGSERIDDLLSSLTLEQEALLEAHAVIEASMNEDFRNSLTQGQKQNMNQLISSSISHEETALLEADRILEELLIKN